MTLEEIYVVMYRSFDTINYDKKDIQNDNYTEEQIIKEYQKEIKRDDNFIPVVDNNENMKLLFLVKVKDM